MAIPHHEIPLLKPLVLFILCIIAAEYFLVGIKISALLVYFICAIPLILYCSKRVNNLFSSIFALVVFFTLGYVNLQERNTSHKTEVFTHEKIYFTVWIDEILPHEKHKKCFVKVLSKVDADNDLSIADGKLLVYFKDSACDSSIVIGNEYLIQAKAFSIQKSNNPYSFDYEKYLSHEGIHHQVFLAEDQYNLLRKNQNSRIDQMIQSVRNHCLNIFQKHFSDQNKLGILYAMVLGKRDSLSKDLNQAFIDTGAIHVLAVSGLHVGILCLFVSIIFKSIEPIIRISSFKRGILSVIIIWTFAAITGGSAAVCRAALMFTMFYIAKDILHRKVSVYNVLCGTAFMLLLFKPSQLFQVGFQFSFLAVLSIVFFYPYVNGIISTRFKLINYFYSSISLGIAAQILVFPLGIFYFNKFANSFLITSLFVVQFAMVILVGGLVILIFESLSMGFINDRLLVPCMNFILEKFQHSIEWVQSMPFSSSENLWLDQWQLIILYLVIISFMYYLKQGRKFIYLGLLLFLGLINYSIHLKQDKSIQMLAYIYDAQDSCIDVFIGNKGLHIGPENNSGAGFIYSRNRLAHSIDRVYSIEQDIESHSVEYKNGLLRLGNKVLAFANVKTFESIKKDQKIDYILVSEGNTDLRKLSLHQLYHAEIIIDGSVKYWEIENLLKFTEENGLSVHNVKSSGAKCIDF